MVLNIEADAIRTKLFDLINEIKQLELRAANSEEGSVELRSEASQQLDAAGCQLAAVYNRIREDFDVFIDASRDDQSFKFHV
jgi:dihydrodipicolinate reductase